MAFNAAALRAIELTSYSADDLVNLLRTTNLKTDFHAVATVLRARERRAAQVEAELKASLDDSLTKIQAHENLRRASLAEAEDSARLRRTAEEEAHAIIMAAVPEIHEAGKKKLDEVSAHLDAVVDEIHALRKWQREDLPASMAKIVEEAEAKLKASFSKIHASLNPPEPDAVPGQGTNDDTTLAMATPSIPVAQQSKQPDVEMVSEGGPAAADGSVGKTLKRKADAVENRGVSPIQISRELQENMEDIGVPPSRIYEKAGPYSYNPLSQPIKVSAKVSNAVASVEGSGTTVTLKEPTPLERSAPTEATQDEPAHVGGDPGMSLITVPVQQVERLDTTTVSKRGRGRGRAGSKEKKNNKKVSGGSASHGIGRGSGRGHGISINSCNHPESAWGQWQSQSLNRDSTVLSLVSVRPVLSCSANGSQSRNGDLFLPSNASAPGINVASGQATAGTRGLVLEEIINPRSCPLRIKNLPMAELRKVTENLGQCVENEADFVAVINNVAEGTSDEEGDVGTSSNSTGGASRGA